MAASRRESSQYAVALDGVLNEDKNDEYDAWLDALLEPASIDFLARFVVGKVGGRDRDPTKCRYVNNARGAYNEVLQFCIDDGQAPSRLALRLPQRGFSSAALAGERLENEVAWMQYLEEQSTVPVPHIYAWGEEDTIGWYMLMDYVEGQTLFSCLLAWEAADKDEGDKDKGAEETGNDGENEENEEKEKKGKERQTNLEKRTFVFEQLAGILLELRSHRFDKIGSIRRVGAGGGGRGTEKGWAVTRRPLTYDMHAQVAGMPGFSTDDWPAPDCPLLHAREYTALATRLRNQQMLCLRNINIPGGWDKEGCLDQQEGDAIDMERALKTARGRFLARRALGLPETWAHLDNDDNDGGGFVLFNPDLSASNILVDPDTGRITALIDFEYTNAVPAALADDPPVWLAHLSYGFVMYLNWGFVAEWQTLYQPTLDAFLGVLERVEQKEEWQQQQQQRQNLPPLSVRMRASWETKRFLVNWALQRAAFADTIYHSQPALFPPVPEAEAAEATDNANSDWTQEVQMYEEYTRWQIDLYEADRKGRLQKGQSAGN